MRGVELALVGGHDVEVAMQDDRRRARAAGAGVGQHDGQPVVVEVA